MMDQFDLRTAAIGIGSAVAAYTIYKLIRFTTADCDLSLLGRRPVKVNGVRAVALTIVQQQ
jgi:hypothetical protein